ncbi:DUF6223 family protein [Streptomyces sp. NPDC003006]
MSVLFVLAAPEAAATVYGMSVGRLGAFVATLAALTGVIVGGLALARPTGRLGTGRGRRTWILVPLVAGPVAMVLGGLIVATSDNGIGTGNGRGGAFVALAVGLLSVALGGLALTRSRRPERPAVPSGPPHR